MLQQPTNPPIPRLLRLVTSIELVVLALAGVGLFVFTDTTRTLWPWPVAPFNAHFLGAVYLASFAALTVMLVGGRWAPARLGLWMLLVYTAPVLVVSFAYLNRFDFHQWLAWGWFLLFIGIPLNAAYHIWLYRRLAPADPTPVPRFWGRLLVAQGVLLGVYGLALLVAPARFTAFWPWHLDEFHGRMYCAMFLAGATASFLLLRGAASVELVFLGIAEASFGVLAIAGVVVVDATRHAVEWSLPGTRLWIGIFTVMFIIGSGLIWLSRTRRPAESRSVRPEER